MFDKRLLITTAALALVTAGSALLVHFTRPIDTAPITETVSGVEQSETTPVRQEPDAEEDGYQYLVREYEGYIAIFSAEQEDGEPELILNTPVRFLPDYDRTMMEQGIQVKDYQELVALIEDFTS